MSKLDEIFENKINTPGDISEHLLTLKKYAERCDVVVELGVRWLCSTYAFLSARPKKLLSFDTVHYRSHGASEEDLNESVSESGTSFEFFQENVITTTNIPECDLLFIDTLHSYKQLKLELYLHATKARKYIILHDVVTYGNQNEGEVVLPESSSEETKNYFNLLVERKGLMPAVTEFLNENNEWKICEFFENNNGLCVLEKVPVNTVNGLPVTVNDATTTFVETQNKPFDTNTCVKETNVDSSEVVAEPTVTKETYPELPDVRLEMPENNPEPQPEKKSLLKRVLGWFGWK